MTDRVLNGVVASFLGTYTSRCSDYQGYWLFGFLVPELTEWRADLLKPTVEDRPPFKYAIDLAVQRLREQIQKNRAEWGQISAAELTLIRDEMPVALEVNDRPTTGWAVRASITVESSRGRRFTAEQRILVASHEPAAEFQSARRCMNTDDARSSL